MTPAQRREQYAHRQAWRAANIEHVRAKQREADIRRRAYQRDMKARRETAVDIYALARAAVPKGLPSFVRDDVIADIVLAFLEGKIKVDQVKAGAKEFLKAHNRMFDQWKTVSLDAPIPGTEMTLLDKLTDEDSIFAH